MSPLLIPMNFNRTVMGSQLSTAKAAAVSTSMDGFTFTKRARTFRPFSSDCFSKSSPRTGIPSILQGDNNVSLNAQHKSSLLGRFVSNSWATSKLSITIDRHQSPHLAHPLSVLPWRPRTGELLGEFRVTDDPNRSALYAAHRPRRTRNKNWAPEFGNWGQIHGSNRS